MKKPHPRPEKDFLITSLALEIDIEKRHAGTGFDPVRREVLVRRYFQFLGFLQANDMTTRIVCASMEELDDHAEWRNSDLTDEGFYFTQRFHGRWPSRTHKDQGEAQEAAFLAKWLADFRK